ncbi:MAG: hypothetical protein WCK29_04500 [archaeon]
MAALPILNTPGKELESIVDWLTTFKEAGCSLVLPVADFNPVLVNNISGHFLIAPSGPKYATLGFDLNSKKIITPDTLIPDIIINSNHIGIYLLNDARHRTYFIYPTIESRDSKDSLINGCNGMYGLPVDWLLQKGFAKRNS